MHKFVLAALLCVLGGASASAQPQQAAARATAPSPKTTGEFLAQGYEIKGVVNDTYLLLQKGDRTFLCGNPDNLTWANWADHTRDASCKSMTR